MANCGWPGDGLVPVTPPIASQAASSRSVSSPGSTTAPFGKFGDGRKQLCGRRHRCGRACRDHRARAVALESRGFRIDQGVAPRRGVHQAELGEICRPRLAHDLEKFERGPEMLVHLVRHQRIERRPVDAARDHVVLQPRQFAGHGEGGGRRIRDQRHSSPVAFLLRGPGQDQLRQRRLALERVHRARQRQAFCCQRAAGEFREHDLVLVDIADRHQTRQDRGIAAERCRETPSCASRQARRVGR